MGLLAERIRLRPDLLCELGDMMIAELKRKRETSRIFERGDSKLWESGCGRIRLRYITGVMGCKVRPKWHVMKLELLHDQVVMWDLVSRHRKKSAAIRSLQQQLASLSKPEPKKRRSPR